MYLMVMRLIPFVIMSECQIVMVENRSVRIPTRWIELQFDWHSGFLI